MFFHQYRTVWHSNPHCGTYYAVVGVYKIRNFPLTAHGSNWWSGCLSQTCNDGLLSTAATFLLWFFGCCHTRFSFQILVIFFVEIELRRRLNVCRSFWYVERGFASCRGTGCGSCRGSCRMLSCSSESYLSKTKHFCEQGRHRLRFTMFFYRCSLVTMLLVALFHMLT